jgi:signal transduction histidine kinase
MPEERMTAVAGAGVRPGPAATAVATTATAVAVVSSERTIAAVVATSRAGALLILFASLGSESWQGSRALPLAVLTIALVAESIGVIGAGLVTGRVSRLRAGLDVACVVALVGLSTMPVVLPGRPGQSPFYNFTVLAVLAFGLPDWPVWATMVATLALAGVNLASAVPAESTYPLWNATLDSAAYLGAGLVAWVLARLLRTSARALDRHRQEAVARAGALARERERARLRYDLGSQLLSTVDELAAADAITDPVVRDQVQREARWLRELVRSGEPEPEPELLPALRDLAAEKTAGGLHIAMSLPDAEPALAPQTVGTVVAAVREALTNVAKHAGTGAARLTVRAQEGGLVMEVVDDGAGYDPATTAERIGQRRSIRDRIEEVGGRVDIESTPGAGTRVTLWVPR